MSNNTAPKKENKSVNIVREMGKMSVGSVIGLIVLVIACVAFYAFMSQSPSKKVIVDDDADIFSTSERHELEELAERLSREEDINVVIVTTRDKGRDYTNSDEDCEEFAGDYYADKCIKTSLVNNSGICILVDLTLDAPGQRFFWIYTYGTAYFAVDDDECTELFRDQKDLLSNGEYYEAISNILDDLRDYDYDNLGYVSFFSLIIPAILALFLTWIVTSPNSLDKKPESKHYSTGGSNIMLTDRVTRTRRIRHESSSGGGFSGGGGFGGGGHSGGGGGRF